MSISIGCVSFQAKRIRLLPVFPRPTRSYFFALPLRFTCGWFGVIVDLPFVLLLCYCPEPGWVTVPNSNKL